MHLHILLWNTYTLLTPPRLAEAAHSFRLKHVVQPAAAKVQPCTNISRGITAVRQLW